MDRFLPFCLLPVLQEKLFDSPFTPTAVYLMLGEEKGFCLTAATNKIPTTLGRLCVHGETLPVGLFFYCGNFSYSQDR